jgi:hypothetical protein
MLKFLYAVLGMTPFAGYRRVIGFVALGGSALIRHVLCDPTIDAAVPFLASTCGAIPPAILTVFDALGVWSGAAGIALAGKK